MPKDASRTAHRFLYKTQRLSKIPKISQMSCAKAWHADHLTPNWEKHVFQSEIRDSKSAITNSPHPPLLRKRFLPPSASLLPDRSAASMAPPLRRGGAARRCAAGVT